MLILQTPVYEPIKTLISFEYERDRFDSLDTFWSPKTTKYINSNSIYLLNTMYNTLTYFLSNCVSFGSNKNQLNSLPTIDFFSPSLPDWCKSNNLAFYLSLLRRRAYYSLKLCFRRFSLK